MCKGTYLYTYIQPSPCISGNFGACVAGVGTMAWSPLAIGLISTKMDDGMPVFTRQSFKVNTLPSSILNLGYTMTHNCHAISIFFF